MTGFQHLLLSSVLIALASLMSVNYDSWSADGRMSVLISMNGLCEDNRINRHLPYWIDCGRYTELYKLEMGDDERIHQFRQSDTLPQIGDRVVINMPDGQS